MPRPYELLDSTPTPEGLLELRRRDRDYMILVGGRVLMTSHLTTSEIALAESGCAPVAHLPRPRVLIGGLGLGFTLRAALSALPKGAQVFVAELNEKVVEWCRGPVAEANGRAALDPRVQILHGDVTEIIRRTAVDGDAPRYDAILWDLYVGPERKAPADHPLYGDRPIKDVSDALSTGGIFGVWGECPSPALEERMKKFSLAPELLRTGGAGLRHAVYLATKRRPRSKPENKTKRKTARKTERKTAPGPKKRR